MSDKSLAATPSKGAAVVKKRRSDSRNASSLVVAALLAISTFGNASVTPCGNALIVAVAGCNKGVGAACAVCCCTSACHTPVAASRRSVLALRMMGYAGSLARGRVASGPRAAAHAPNSEAHSMTNAQRTARADSRRDISFDRRRLLRVGRDYTTRVTKPHA